MKNYLKENFVVNILQKYFMELSVKLEKIKALYYPHSEEFI